MRYVLALLFLVLVAPSAQAEPSVDPLLCQQLVGYQAPESADANYKPGVDVNGNPVVEADVAPPVIPAPEEYEFPITVNIAEYIGMNMPAGLMGEARIGSVSVGQDGQVLFNGKPMESEAETALKELCGIKAPESSGEPENKGETEQSN